MRHESGEETGRSVISEVDVDDNLDVYWKYVMSIV